ncbi:dipeptidase [Hymenobacter caeli]|uniref:Membrane dipeptidase n=1 Tax=Hymenobacter caeli TaxID=2735894 RepID=A0ABX2FQU3_9BACT|nr:dipeptidase [Hymenobacter caeli]NRT18864.1 membrane dipeptidase [Hymenobacter caeli]
MPDCHFAAQLPLLLLLFAARPAAAQTAEAKLQAKAHAIHAKAFVVDAHEDTPSKHLVKPGFDLADDHAAKEDGQVDLPKMKRGGLDAAFWVVYVGQGPRAPAGYAAIRQEVQAQFDAIHAAIRRYPTELALATTPAEARRIRRAGQRALFIGMENGYPVGQDLAMLQAYYNQGARYLTLCHSSNNDLCDSATDPKGPEWQGLSPLGERAVREMNRLGMMVDVSHTSDSTFYDVLRASRVPVIASHSGSRVLADMPRNLTDAMLRALARHGGVVQLNLFSPYVKTEVKTPARQAAEQAFYTKWSIKTFLNVYALPAADRTQALAEYVDIERKYPVSLATVQDAANQIDHLVQVAGIDHVGIGSDFDGGSVLDGLADVGDFPHLTLELLRRGYSARALRKIWGGNLFRVMDAVARGKGPPPASRH